MMEGYRSEIIRTKQFLTELKGEIAERISKLKKAPKTCYNDYYKRLDLIDKLKKLREAL